MKIIITTLLAVVLFGCNCKKTSVTDTQAEAKKTEQMQQLPTLEYEASTRGFRKKITIKNGLVLLIVESQLPSKPSIEPTERMLSTQELTDLVSLYSKVNVNQLSELKPPSTAHTYDGALLAKLTITLDNKIYRTQTFDDGNPPAEIKGLVSKMLEIAQVKQ